MQTSAVLDAYVHDLEQAFDPGRLAPYYPKNGDKLAIVTAYLWNVALCKELYLSLGTVEVTIRNAVHDSLTAHFNAADWYDEPGLLQDREAKAIAAAKGDIRDTTACDSGQGCRWRHVWILDWTHERSVGRKPVWHSALDAEKRRVDSNCVPLSRPEAPDSQARSRTIQRQPHVAQSSRTP